MKKIRLAVAAALFALPVLAAMSLPTGSLALSSREVEAAVLFDHIPGTIHDVPARITLAVLPDDVVLQSVSMRREPYRLSDGLRLLQTADCETRVYVRQIIEHPRAQRTVVVYPGESSGAAASTSRVLAMLDLALLNPDRHVVAAHDGRAVRLYGDLPDAPVHAPGAARAWSLLSSGANATAVFSHLANLAPRSVDDLPPAESDSDHGRAESARSVVEEMIARADPVLGVLLDGQGLLVVRLVEREIREGVRGAEVTNREIDVLNELQNRLAVLFGRSSTLRFIFEPGYPPAHEAAAILRQIDEMLGTSTERIMTEGRTGMRRLFLERIPDSVARLRDDELTRIVERTGEQSLLFVETTEDGLYRLIRTSVESSAFNLIVMGGAVAAPARRMEASVRTTFIDPTLVSDRSWMGSTRTQLKLAVEELRIRAAGAGLEPDSAVITFEAESDGVVFLGIAHRDGAHRPETRLLVLPASSPRDVSQAVEIIKEAEAVDHLERRILVGWALIAQTVMDL